jgi:hypothetical protein
VGLTAPLPRTPSADPPYHPRQVLLAVERVAVRARTGRGRAGDRPVVVEGDLQHPPRRRSASAAAVPARAPGPPGRPPAGGTAPGAPSSAAPRPDASARAAPQRTPPPEPPGGSGAPVRAPWSRPASAPRSDPSRRRPHAPGFPGRVCAPGAMSSGADGCSFPAGHDGRPHRALLHPGGSADRSVPAVRQTAAPRANRFAGRTGEAAGGRGPAAVPPARRGCGAAAGGTCTARPRSCSVAVPQRRAAEEVGSIDARSGWALSPRGPAKAPVLRRG